MATVLDFDARRSTGAGAASPAVSSPVPPSLPPHAVARQLAATVASNVRYFCRTKYDLVIKLSFMAWGGPIATSVPSRSRRETDG
jgi:hypothetical protein